jgi:hypothetical protein
MARGNEWSSAKSVARVVQQCLKEGKPVEIDGLGRFLPIRRRGIRFVPRTQPKVFLAYVQEDAKVAERLFDALWARGFDPWLDRRKLLPGQNWPRSIEEAIETSKFVIACFSGNSVSKKGGFQAEIRYALDCARRMPLDDIYLIPVRLDACRVPPSIQRETQYIDLFPRWERGLARILSVIRKRTKPRPPARPRR